MATFETIVRELTKLKSVTRPRQQDAIDFKLQIAAMAKGLIDLPNAAVEGGCGGWAEISQWFPTLAELRAECIRHKPAQPVSAVPRLEVEGFTDKRWWYDRCAKNPDDLVLVPRARELYPSMFYENGDLVDATQVNYQAQDRQTIPARTSQAYIDAGVDMGRKWAGKPEEHET